MTEINIRDAVLSDLGRLSEIWYEAWHDAHDRIVPPDLVTLRTRASFETRLRAALPDVRVATLADAARGFYVLRGAELYQLFVSASARGTGLAARLIADAERRLTQNEVGCAWLSCAIGNSRAARFYEKCGWSRTGVITEHVEVPNGTFALEVWRYEKQLSQ